MPRCETEQASKKAIKKNNLCHFFITLLSKQCRPRKSEIDQRENPFYRYIINDSTCFNHHILGHVQFPSDQSTNQSLALNIRVRSVSGELHKYLTGLFDGRLLCKHAEIDFEAYRTRTATPAWFHDGIL